MNQSRKSQDNKLVIFSHILKTGGRTLGHIMYRQYRYHLIRIPQAPFNAQEHIHEMKKLAASSNNNIKAVEGHIGFGLHSVFPQNFIYITMLRNPIERVLSSFYHQRRNWQVYQEDWMNITLEEFLSKQPCFSYNLQTRYLSGFEFNQQLQGKWAVSSLFDLSLNEYEVTCTNEMLEAAKRNLRDHYFGLTERFDESLLLFRRNLGWKWKDLWYVKDNVGTNRPVKEVLSEDIQKQLVKVNELDIELYRYAEQLFEERITRQTKIQRELAAFKLINLSIAKTYPYAQSLLKSQ